MVDKDCIITVLGKACRKLVLRNLYTTCTYYKHTSTLQAKHGYRAFRAPARPKREALLSLFLDLNIPFLDNTNIFQDTALDC